MSEGGHRAWAEEEFGRAMLSDKRNLERVVSMAAQLAERPHAALPRVFPAASEARNAYALLNNEEVCATDLLTARSETCARRCDGGELIIVAGDGSSWSFTDTQRKRQTGSIGARKQGARGLKVHSLFAMLPDGTPLGILEEQVWARDDVEPSVPHAKRALEDRESFWWTELPRRAALTLATTCKRPPKLWFQFDRDADSTDVLLYAACSDHYVTVRADANRNLAAGSVARRGKSEAKLDEGLAMAEKVAEASIRVRAKGRFKRIARAEVLVGSVSLRLRKQWSKTHLGDLPTTVVVVRELKNSGRGGDEPLEWILYTTYPIREPEDVLLVVKAYALRWRIERHHFTTKSGACELPKSQLHSFDARRKWIVLHTSVSARLQHVLYRARSEPDVLAVEEFAPQEVEATQLLLVGRNMAVPFKSPATATLAQVVESIARLGGYQGPKRTKGPPGIQTLERGFEQVEAARVVLQAQKMLRVAHGARDDGET